MMRPTFVILLGACCVTLLCCNKSTEQIEKPKRFGYGCTSGNFVSADAVIIYSDCEGRPLFSSEQEAQASVARMLKKDLQTTK